MKTGISVVVALVLAIAFCSATPAAACFTCRDAGPLCGVDGCVEVYTCDYTDQLCGRCYEDCWEQGGGDYCHLDTFCLFAELPPAADRMSLALPALARRAQLCALQPDFRSRAL